MANERARYLRGNQTDAEKRLWQQLRHLKSRGFHFRRQVPIDRMIVDFACYSVRLVIEVDGGQHGEQKGLRADVRRDTYLACNGFRVLRFWNNDVLKNISGVMQAIHAVLLKTPAPTPPRKGEGFQAANAPEAS